MSSTNTATARSSSPAEKVGPTVRVFGLVKSYPTIDLTIRAVDGMDLDIEGGTAVAVTGTSGSGKSTLLHLIGALDHPDAGTITVDGRDITNLRGRDAATYRRTVGFVFQRFNLLPTLTALDSVAVPVVPIRGKANDGRRRALDLLTAVGLAGREHTIATRLSGGQQQRVAIARAMINRPRLVLADEPTGNLDSTTGAEIIDLLLSLRWAHRATIVLATHDAEMASRCDRAVQLKDGRVVG